MAKHWKIDAPNFRARIYSTWENLVGKFPEILQGREWVKIEDQHQSGWSSFVVRTNETGEIFMRGRYTHEQRTALETAWKGARHGHAA